jgi:peptidoglycan/LPS O-acetylase OafA/YrhL
MLHWPGWSAMAGGTTGYRPDINGLRAVAILLVVVFHTGFGWVPGGFIGVDVFFVISGFLITGQLLTEVGRSGGVSLASFWARRARRLLPLSSLVIVVTVVLGMAISSPLGRQQIATDATVAGLYISNWHFAQQSVAYAEALVADGLFTQFWSLSIEEQFYVLLPLLVFAVVVWGRKQRESFATRLFLVVFAVVALSFALSVWLTPTKGEAAYFLTYTRLWELGVGVLLAIVMQRYPKLFPRAANGLTVVGGAAIICSAFLFDGATGYPGWKALLPVAGTVLVVAFGGRAKNWTGRLLSITPLVVIGTWSYGWYLWHWPMIAMARSAGRRWFPDLDTNALIVFAIVLSLLLAAITYQFVENPIRYSSFLVNWPRRSLVMGAVLTITAAMIGPLLLGVVDAGQSRIIIAGDTTSRVVPMTPLQARQDRKVKCIATNGESEVPETWTQDECVYGDPNGDVTFVLLGDSHAEHWYSALDIAGRERGWKFVSLTKAGCPANSVELSPKCSEWREDVFKKLRELGGIDAIIVSNAQFYATTMLEVDGKSRSREEALASWAEGSAKAYSNLLTISNRVIRLGDIPTPDFDVPDCLSENLATPENCALDLGPTLLRNRDLIAAERSQSPPSVDFIDPSALVCPTDPCPVVDDSGRIKYRDWHHMTGTFSASLAQRIGDLISSVLRVR